ncbi:uncharacterized protein LOC132302170 [Cornus florida]|uniref:uncharacterized protein LOC132302170 n=1 Tax=Cornus florida TaxID=4283 RepID=UPI00289DE040|nr:uncharacterized protein LOC132302170 [Cornus florida]
MGGKGARLPSFCLNKIRRHVRVREVISGKKDQKNENSVNVGEANSGGATQRGLGLVIGRKIMVVIDSSLEAKGALHWALTHTIQSQDIVVLLYVAKPSKQGEESSTEIAPRVSEFLQSMKTMCKRKMPEVKFEVTVAEGKEKGPAIVEETKKQGVALLVLGQKKRSAVTWRLLMTWAGNRSGGGGGGGGVVEYCIQNASCMAIAVRRKSKKLGGYLITTKCHKNFWLLA